MKHIKHIFNFVEVTEPTFTKALASLERTASIEKAYFDGGYSVTEWDNGAELNSSFGEKALYNPTRC